MSDHDTHWRAKQGGIWNRCVAVLGLGLLAILPLIFTAVDYPNPKTSSQGQGASTRAGWYLRSGQWRADIRTLVAAFEFVMDSAPQAPASFNSPIKRLAAPSGPVGPNPPTMTQVKDGGPSLTKS